MTALVDPRYEKFAQHYAIHRKAKAAATEAGFPSGTDARAILMRREVGLRLKEIWGLAMDNVGLTPDVVMQQLRNFAFPDVRRLYDEKGDFLPVHELDDETAATITAIDVETRMERVGANEFTPVKTTKIRRVDPMPALGILAKHFKIVGDEGEGINALANALADRLKTARQRAFNRPSNTPSDIEDARIIPRRALVDTPPTPTEATLMEQRDEQLW